MLKRIDIFDKDFKFTYDLTSFKTNFGGFMSFLMACSTLILTWYFGQDIYQRKKPIFIIKSDRYPEHPFYNLTNENFFFGISIIDVKGKPLLDKKYYYAVLMYNSYHIDKEKGENVVKKSERKILDRCDTTFVSKKDFDRFHLGNYYCGNFDNMNVGGVWYMNNELGDVSIDIKKCDSFIEKKYNLKCATNEEIRERYSSPLYITTYKRKNLIDPRNYLKPVRYTFDHDWMILSANQSTIQQFFYSISHIETDSGWIFKNIEDHNLLEFSKNTMREATGAKHLSLATVEILITQYFNIYSRSYIKIPNIAAEVGGFMKIAFYIARYLISYYLDSEFKVFLYRKLFNLEIEEEEQQKVNKLEEYSYKSKLYQFNKENRNLLVEMEDLSLSKIKLQESGIWVKKPPQGKRIQKAEIEVLNKDIKQVIKFKEKQRKRIEITCLEQFRYSFCSFNIDYLNKSNTANQKTRLELLILAEKELEKRMNIVNLLREQDKFDLLKKVILNEGQSYMLKNIDLKSLVNASNKDSIQFLEEKKEVESLEKLREYISKKRNGQDFNCVELLIFNSLPEDFKEKLK